MAVITTSVFVACKKNNASEIIEQRGKSKFYGKLGQIGVVGRNVNLNNFTFDDLNDNELIELAKESGYEHNQSLLNLERTLNLENSTNQEKRVNLVNSYNEYFGINTTNLDFLNITDRFYYEGKTENEIIEIGRAGISNETVLGFYNNAIELVLQQKQNTDIAAGIAILESQIKASGISKKDKFMLYAAIEVAYSSYKLWKELKISNTQYKGLIENQELHLQNTYTASEFNFPMSFIIDMLATVRIFNADGNDYDDQTAFIHALVSGAQASYIWSTGCHCHP
jgi:hypothetical protein